MPSKCPLVLTTCVLLSMLGASKALAQMTNDSFGALVVDGVDGSPPNRAMVFGGEVLEIAVSGMPNRPFLLASAPMLSVNDVVYGPGIAADIGPSSAVTILVNGLESPQANFFNLFGNTGPSGTAILSLPLPAGIGNGARLALQAFVIDFSTPLIVQASAACEVTMVDRPGGVGFEATTLGLSPTYFFSNDGDDAAIRATTFDLVSYHDIALARFGEFYALEGSLHVNANPPPGSIRRFDVPTATRPLFVSGARQHPHVRTIHGDIQHVSKLTGTGVVDGFIRIVGTAPVEIDASFMPSSIVGQTAWKSHVNMENGVMAGVVDGQGFTNDRIFLMKIDGTTFAGSGTAITDVTPVVSPPSIIRPESLSFAGGVLWFAGGATSTPSQLYRAPLDGSSLATSVTLPVVSGTAANPTVVVSKDMRVSESGQHLFVRLATAGDVIGRAYRISNITPSSQTFDLVTLFSPSRGTLEWGRASDGTGNRFSASPSATRCATIAKDFTNTTQEIYLSSVTNGVISQVTVAARFVNAIDTVMECLHWDDDNCLFWAGTTETEMDLYNFEISTSILTNLTQTNGQSGMVLPINTTTLAKVDPMGQFRAGDYFYFVRGGVAANGTDVGQNVTNICGVHLPTLTLFNVTGDEFPGTAAPSIFDDLHRFDLFVDPASARTWFTSGVLGVTEKRIGSFLTNATDVVTFSAATSTPDPTGTRYVGLAPDRLHAGCFAIRTSLGPAGGDGVILVDAAGNYDQVAAPIGTDVVRAFRTLPEVSGVDGLFLSRETSSPGTPSIVELVLSGLGTRRQIATPSPIGFVQFLGTEAP